MDIVTRVSICQMAAQEGGSLDWREPLIDALDSLPLDTAIAELQAAKVVTLVKRKRRMMHLTLRDQPLAAAELVKLSPENRCIAAQIDLLRDQDPAFSTSYLDTLALGERLLRIYPGLNKLTSREELFDLLDLLVVSNLI